MSNTELDNMLSERGLTQAFEAWNAQGIKCDIEHTGGNVWCVVAELENGLTAVRGEEGFAIFTNDEWNAWIKATEEVDADDHQAQIKWIKDAQNPLNKFEVFEA